MKKQYNAPLQFVINLQGAGIIAASAQISTDASGNPHGENLNNISGDDGDAWGGAAAKEHSAWGEEW
ncbi:MAG: hypothetical protein IJ148_08420 [Bacteroidaceae bacterium]|nr:hypothetical protein [Bacteroidaceae bacterium]